MADEEKYKLKHGGRTVRITVVINTDADIHTIASAVQAVARGPENAMVLVMGELVDQGAALPAWIDAIAKAKSQDRINAAANASKDQNN